MQMDSINDLEVISKVQERSVSGQRVVYTEGVNTITKTDAGEKATGVETERQEDLFGKEKEPAQSSIEDALSKLNAQIAKTHCAYSYDKDTKRISIKVYDDETDELIREVPPEKSLEALKKMWQIAGIIVDEKR